MDLDFNPITLDRFSHSIHLGWKYCQLEPALDDPHGPGFEEALTRAIRRRPDDPGAVHLGIVLFLGLPPLAGLRCEKRLLRFKGAVATQCPGVEEPVMIAAAARIHRLRNGLAPGRGNVCPHRRAFMEGLEATGTSEAHGAALSRLLDRYGRVAGLRARLGTARCAREPLSFLEGLAKTGADAIAEAGSRKPEAGSRKPEAGSRKPLRPSIRGSPDLANCRINAYLPIISLSPTRRLRRRPARAA